LAKALCMLGLLVLPATALPAGPMQAVSQEQSPAAGRQRVLAFTSLMHALGDSSVNEQLERVNRFFNAFAFRSDAQLWGVQEHWSTPAELLKTGAGDCEDLAIAKYFALRRLGFPVDTLRITYMRDARRGRAHMALIYRASGVEQVLLDSRADGPPRAVNQSELLPVYGFNERRVVIGMPAGGERSFPHAGRWVLRHWQALRHRMRAAAPGVPSVSLLPAASRVH